MKKKLRKPGKPLLPFKILRNCVFVSIPMRRHMDSTRNYPEVSKRVTNSGNLVELLQHGVKEGDNKLENQHDILFQLRFFCFVFVEFQGKLRY